MTIKLRRLEEQVIFITGATSGIGLATVHKAVEQGARIYMVARNENELLKLQNEMKAKGYETAFGVADVSNIDQLRKAAEKCLTTFGRIDTFINNAENSIYAHLLDTNLEEAKRFFDTNFWGVVNGCKIAVPLMKKYGGAIINIESVLSNVSIPIQGVYSASKHAVKAYTDALRRELLAADLPLQVTLIFTGSIDTPFTLHAASKIGEPFHTPPVYPADLVAKAILKCSIKPTRELRIGSTSFLYPIFDKLFPKVLDDFMARFLMEMNQSDNSQNHTRLGLE